MFLYYKKRYPINQQMKKLTEIHRDGKWNGKTNSQTNKQKKKQTNKQIKPSSVCSCYLGCVWLRREQSSWSTVEPGTGDWDPASGGQWSVAGAAWTPGSSESRSVYHGFPLPICKTWSNLMWNMENEKWFFVYLELFVFRVIAALG